MFAEFLDQNVSPKDLSDYALSMRGEWFNKEQVLASDNKAYGVKRLLNCNNREVVMVNDEIKNIKWCVYSHCWDEEANKSLKIANVNWTISLSDDKLDAFCSNALQLGYQMCWVDNLCIDQSNYDEKTVAIPAMSSIYGNNDCLVLIRDIDQNHCKKIYELWNESDKYKFLLSDELLIRNLDSNGIKYLNELASMLEFIFSNRWFKRVWTMQEFILPKKLIFVTYDKYIFDKEMLIQLSYFRIVLNMAYKLGKISTPINHLEQQAMSIFQSSVTWSGSLSDIFTLMRGRVASVPEDHIYGLLGLCNKKIVDNITIKYSIGFEAAFNNLIAASISMGDMTLFGAKKNRKHNGVPDIDINIFNNYNPGMMTAPNSANIFENNQLKINGTIGIIKMELVSIIIKPNNMRNLADILGELISSNKVSSQMVVSAALNIPISNMTYEMSLGFDYHASMWKNNHPESKRKFIHSDDAMSYVLRVLLQQITGWKNDTIWIAEMNISNIGKVYALVSAHGMPGAVVYGIDVGVKYKSINASTGLILNNIENDIRCIGSFCSIRRECFNQVCRSITIGTPEK